MENQNTHFVSNRSIPKIVQLVRQLRKIWHSQTGHRWSHTVWRKRRL